MYRPRLAIVLLLLSPVFAQDPSFQRRKNETIAKADEIFGQRYTPVAGKPMRLYDEQTETGPPDAVIYCHGPNYVIELVFAADATVAKIVLLPEALLHSNYYGDVPKRVELSPGEMRWLVASANLIRPLGHPLTGNDAPNLCFQSGPNSYCADHYEFAIVSHYHLQQVNEQGLSETALKDTGILYEQSVVGIVEDATLDGGQRHLKVGGHWYQGNKHIEPFDKTEIGSLVRLVTYGCTPNEKACTGMTAKSTSTAAKQ
jgi:hypothetical protein